MDEDGWEEQPMERQSSKSPVGFRTPLEDQILESSEENAEDEEPPSWEENEAPSVGTVPRMGSADVGVGQHLR